MYYDKIIAPTLEDAKREAKRKYGQDCFILDTKEEKVYQDGLLGFFGKKKTRCILTCSVPDSYFKRQKCLDVLNKKNDDLKIGEKSSINDVSVNAKNDEQYERKSNSVSVSREDDSNNLEARFMEKIERMIDRKLGNQTSKSEASDLITKNLNELREILENNEFSTLFIEELLENIRKSLSISQIENRIEVQKYAYNYLEGCISKIVGSDEHLLSEDEKCVMVLVGPTGIGKTTTLAKIAANIKMKEKKGVEIVTMDGYRIGAKEQIGRYAELIGIKCTYTDTCEELNKTILMSKESLVLIDTTGRSQQDGIELAKMRDFLRLKAIRPRFVLGVSATTKPKEVRNIFKNFSIFDYDQIIITKNDESETIGSILSCAIEFKKKIMFSTNGQKVPSDIEKVSKSNLMQKITGFSPEVYLENLEF